MIPQIALAGVLAFALPLQSFSQTQAPSVSQGAAVAPVAPAADTAVLGGPQLDALLAPIALYPDPLLAQVLMASTYPLEVVQADRWVAENKKLSADALKSAAEKQGWDDSIKALVATPSVLEMMSKNLEWTKKLGDALLAQEADVMGAVQRMRSRAYDNKKLTSGAQQTVTVRQESGKQTIEIVPAAPDTVYVPYYDPGVVYGSWPYPESPPYYFPAPGYIAAGVLATGLAFGAAYGLGRWATGGYWGGNVNWNSGNININRDRATHWQHNPQHRQGVRYGNSSVQQRFANTSRPGAEGRTDFRGRDGDQARPDRPDRPNVGNDNRPDRGQGANRPDRPDRGQGANRPDRPDAGAGARPDRGPGDRPAAADRARQNRPNAERPAQRPAQANRPGGGNANRAAPARDNAFGNVQSGRAANLQSQRGRASAAHAGPRMGGGGYGGGPRAGAGGFGGGGGRVGGGGGGARMGGGGGGRGGGGGGGGRRSDIALKDQVVELGRLQSGIGFYRFAYRGGGRLYVGVMAQEVQEVAPDAVTRGADGFLRVRYDRIGIRFQTYDQWRASGSHVPGGTIHRDCTASAQCRAIVPAMSEGVTP